MISGGGYLMKLARVCATIWSIGGGKVVGGVNSEDDAGRVESLAL